MNFNVAPFCCKREENKFVFFFGILFLCHICAEKERKREGKSSIYYIVYIYELSATNMKNMNSQMIYSSKKNKKRRKQITHRILSIKFEEQHILCGSHTNTRAKETKPIPNRKITAWLWCRLLLQ